MLMFFMQLIYLQLRKYIQSRKPIRSSRVRASADSRGNTLSLSMLLQHHERLSPLPAARAFSRGRLARQVTPPGCCSTVAAQALTTCSVMLLILTGLYCWLPLVAGQLSGGVARFCVMTFATLANTAMLVLYCCNLLPRKPATRGTSWVAANTNCPPDRGA